jgi:hypothetical protein
MTDREINLQDQVSSLRNEIGRLRSGIRCIIDMVDEDECLGCIGMELEDLLKSPRH